MLLSRSMMASVGSSEHGPQRLLRNPSGATVPVKTHPVKCSLSPLTRWDCYLKCQETLLKVKNLFLLMCKMSFLLFFFLNQKHSLQHSRKKHTSFKLVRNEIKTHQKPSWLRLVPTITNCVKIWNFPGCTRRFAPPAASPMSALPLIDNFHYCSFDFVTSQI